MKELINNPDLADVVVTWQAGNRSTNYFAQCYPVALFEFPLDKELKQLIGRSNREFPTKKEFRGAFVNNEDTRRRKLIADEKTREEAEKAK